MCCLTEMQAVNQRLVPLGAWNELDIPSAIVRNVKHKGTRLCCIDEEVPNVHQLCPVKLEMDALRVPEAGCEGCQIG